MGDLWSGDLHKNGSSCTYVIVSIIADGDVRWYVVRHAGSPKKPDRTPP